MSMKRNRQSGFTLIEISIVLLIVTIMLGYTVALFPKQQELKQYRAVDQETDKIIEAIIGFAQVNGRLPCPAIPNSLGTEAVGGVAGCNYFGGFVPTATLGIGGRLNGDSLLIDPWGNPYRYYVSSGDVGGVAGSDFIMAGDMRTVGLVDIVDIPNADLSSDTYIDLDGQYIICDAAGFSADDLCDGANIVFGNPSGSGGPYAGAPFVLVSHGKDWNQAAAVGDQLANMGNTLSTALNPPMPNGPTGVPYLLKNLEITESDPVGNPGVFDAFGETTFVKRTTGLADDFDDIVKWASPNLLFSKMIEADQLP